MPARRRSNNGGGETYLERLLAEFSGCCRPEEAQRPSYRAASPAAAAAPRPGWPAPDAAADTLTPPTPPQTRRSSSIVSDPDTLSPRAVSLLIAAAELDKLSLGALCEALANARTSPGPKGESHGVTRGVKGERARLTPLLPLPPPPPRPARPRRRRRGPPRRRPRRGRP